MGNPTNRLGMAMARALREAVDARGMSQTEMARRLGIRQSHVSEVLNGKSTASVWTLDKWAALLGHEWEVTLVPVSPAEEQ